MEEWLEVVLSPFQRLRAAGDGALRRGLPGELGESAARAFTASLTLVAQWAGPSPELTPSPLRPHLAALGIDWLDPLTDRLHGFSLEVFTASSVRIHYELCGVPGAVTFRSWDGGLEEEAGSRLPFELCRGRSRAWAAGGLGAGLALAAWYGFRHPFYLGLPQMPLLFFGAVLLALFLLPAARAACLPRKAAAPQRAAWLAVVLLLGGALATLAATGGPTLEHALALERDGRREEALAEAAACVDLGRDAERARSFHDELRVARTLATPSPDEAWKEAAERFYRDAARSRAERHALSRSLAEAAALQERGLYEESLALLGKIPARLQAEGEIARLRHREVVHRAERLRAEIESDALVSEKLATCERLLAYGDLWGLWTAEVPAPLSQRALEKRCLDLQVLELRQQEAERRASERRRKAEERTRRLEARRARSADSSPLLCRDGTLSPSCVCGGPRRGCCSHHGGVAGCS